MSMSIEMTYDNNKRDARKRGWKTPKDGSDLDQPSWYQAWIDYWEQLRRNEISKAINGPDGPELPRPVIPHRS